MDIRTENLIKTSVKSLTAKKAEDIRVLKISELSSIADFFIIATGNNNRHVISLADETQEKLEILQETPTRTDGYKNADWIVLDYADVIIHIFKKDTRDFFGLEKLWEDALDLTEEYKLGAPEALEAPAAPGEKIKKI